MNEGLNNKYQEFLEQQQKKLIDKSFRLPAGQIDVSFDGRVETKKYGQPQENEKMTFNQNNGVFVFVDKFNDVYVFPANSDTHEKLINAGYKENRILGVPFSNGEKPSDPRLLKEWEDIFRK